LRRLAHCLLSFTVFWFCPSLFLPVPVVPLPALFAFDRDDSTTMLLTTTYPTLS
jgi:hypothetical protein